MTVEKTVFDYEPRSSCKDWYDSGVRKSGLYIIKLVETSSAFQVYCDMENDGGGWTLVSNFRETSRNCQSNAYGILTSPSQSSHARLSDAQIQSLQGDGSGHFRYTRGEDSNKAFWRYRAGYDNRLFHSQKSHGHGGMQSGNIHEVSTSINGPWYCGPENSGCSYSAHYGLDTWNTGYPGIYFIWCYGGQNYANGARSSYEAALWVREGDINVGSSVTSSEFTFKFNGECASGLKAHMYEGSGNGVNDNEGTEAEKTQRCFEACKGKKTSLNNVDWSSFAANGFIVDATTGRCYCEAADSTCTITKNGYKRYDVISSKSFEGFWYTSCEDRRRNPDLSGSLSLLRNSNSFIEIFFRPRNSNSFASSTNYRTCQEILLTNPLAKTGWYDLAVGGEKFLTKCDMETDGGGWTLLAHELTQVDYQKSFNFEEIETKGVGIPSERSDLFFVPLKIWSALSVHSNMNNKVVVRDNSCRSTLPSSFPGCVNVGQRLVGNYLKLTGDGLSELSIFECYENCILREECSAWSWTSFKHGFSGYCSLHQTGYTNENKENFVSGVKTCTPTVLNACVYKNYEISPKINAYKNSENGLRLGMSETSCQRACARDTSCQHWMWQASPAPEKVGYCYLSDQATGGNPSASVGVISGSKDCNPYPYPSCVTEQSSYSSVSLLAPVQAGRDERSCFEFCQNEKECAAWTWVSALSPVDNYCNIYNSSVIIVRTGSRNSISGLRDCHPRPAECAPSIDNMRVTSKNYNLGCGQASNSAQLSEACSNNLGFTTEDHDADLWSDGNCVAPKKTGMSSSCGAVEASQWAGPHDFVSGGSRYGCSPSTNDNLLGYINSLVQGDFDFSLVVNNAVCGAGIVFGFVETEDPTALPTGYPEMSTILNRWGYSTICVGPDSKPGYIWADSKGASRNSHDEYRDDIDMVDNDKLTLKREGNVFTFYTNDVLKYTYSKQSSGNGYIWVGHYNSGTAQCFSSPKLCLSSPTGDGTSKEHRTGFWYGDCSSSDVYDKTNGGLSTWSPTPIKNNPAMKTVCKNSENEDWKSPDFSIDPNSNSACVGQNSAAKYTLSKRLVRGAFAISVNMQGNPKDVCQYADSGVAIGFVEGRTPNFGSFEDVVDFSSTGQGTQSKRWSWDAFCGCGRRIGRIQAKDGSSLETGCGSGTHGDAKENSRMTLTRVVGADGVADTFVLKRDGKTKYTFSQKGSGDGYIWIAHYTLGQGQLCFSNVETCTSTAFDASMFIQTPASLSMFGTTRLEYAMQCKKQEIFQGSGVDFQFSLLVVPLQRLSLLRGQNLALR